MKTIRITMTTNAAARKCDVLSWLPGAKMKHNGGKVIIATITDGNLELVESYLKASFAVASYEIKE